jgi:hypothetical protein
MKAMAASKQEDSGLPTWFQGVRSAVRPGGLTPWFRLNQICAHGLRAFLESLSLARRLGRKPGEPLNLDAFGLTLEPYRPSTGEIGFHWVALWVANHPSPEPAGLSTELLKAATDGMADFADPAAAIEEVRSYCRSAVTLRRGSRRLLHTHVAPPSVCVLWEWTDDKQDFTLRAMSPVRWRLRQLRLLLTGWRRAGSD